MEGNICKGQLDADLTLVLSEDKGECHSWVEVRSRDLPEENSENPKSKQDAHRIATAKEECQEHGSNELHDQF